ncbi:efflux RND transporter periplasmic adaptor subunit [Hyphomicrobium sp.]|uniref:efflux RND transporter periplasmic adaptor subunit n=1 Tax=Hyphomicrobium sp. TaxID=82 RepID=UPI002BE9AAE8|nr:efflux RND transporter periplasmic adaptor subunit [Hyphomicrobium sp.]HRN88308.1 efflux RND transporter periplasmic adaptor subunit [Hyphomicrobium sp.]HRQ26549.1 efflux RND transporter periplasmic adaptor subunit [Hyphomicrobium sp.]
MLKVLLVVCALLVISAGAALHWSGESPQALAERFGVAERLGLLRASNTPAEPTAPTSPQAALRPPEGVAVETAIAVATTSTEDLRAIGTLQSDESVQISPEIAGRVTDIPLSEGKPVAAGDVLVKLDDALARAEVSDAEARYELAVSNLRRADRLAESGNVTERARDEAKTNAETTRAALELSKVRLDKHTIRAPFSGVAGIRRVSPGAYVAAGHPIVNLEKIDTLKIDFKLPELFLSQIRTGQKIKITVDAFQDRTFEGAIYVIDPHLDVNGRALNIRARLENPDLVLRPGLFARIFIEGQIKRDVVVVPESAIVPRGQDKFVYRVENGEARETKVTLGNRKDGKVEVLEGLRAEETVVVAGQQKLRDGAPVEIVTGSREPRARGT